MPRVSTFVGRSISEFLCPRPLGGEGGSHPALSPAGARRGEGVHARASYPDASGNDPTASKTFCTNISGASWTMPLEKRGATPLVRCPLACGEVRAPSGFARRSEQENAWCDRDARPSWFPPRPRLLTPSPVSPRLMTTPVARHPLPQGGEGNEFTRTVHDHRNHPRPRRFRSLVSKM